MVRLLVYLISSPIGGTGSMRKRSKAPDVLVRNWKERVAIVGDLGDAAKNYHKVGDLE